MVLKIKFHIFHLLMNNDNGIVAIIVVINFEAYSIIRLVITGRWSEI